jgi:hypothetical protein
MAATEPTSNSMFAPAADGPASPLYIDTQHDDMVHDAQLDYYGCKLATSSSGMSKAISRAQRHGMIYCMR